MTDDVKKLVSALRGYSEWAKENEKLVSALREHAEWAKANEFETPITLGDDIEKAAKTIEHLSFYSETAIRAMLFRGNSATCHFCTKPCISCCPENVICADVAMRRGPCEGKEGPRT